MPRVISRTLEGSCGHCSSCIEMHINIPLRQVLLVSILTPLPALSHAEKHNHCMQDTKTKPFSTPEKFPLILTKSFDTCSMLSKICQIGHMALVLSSSQKIML